MKLSSRRKKIGLPNNVPFKTFFRVYKVFKHEREGMEVTRTKGFHKTLCLVMRLRHHPIHIKF